MKLSLMRAMIDEILQQQGDMEPYAVPEGGEPFFIQGVAVVETPGGPVAAFISGPTAARIIRKAKGDIH